MIACPIFPEKAERARCRSLCIWSRPRHSYKDAAFPAYINSVYGALAKSCVLSIDLMMRMSKEEKENKILSSEFLGSERNFKKGRNEWARPSSVASWTLAREKGSFPGRPCARDRTGRIGKPSDLFPFENSKVSFHLWKEWKIRTQNMTDQFYSHLPKMNNNFGRWVVNNIDFIYFATSNPVEERQCWQTVWLICNVFGPYLENWRKSWQREI